jgi:hypothetical protein
VLTGKRIERSKIGAPGEFESLSDGELLAALVERFARLAQDDHDLQRAIIERFRAFGLTPDAGSDTTRH